MNIEVFFAPLFERKFKRYAKKFISLDSDLKQFLSTIEKNPSVDLGGGIYKYRLAVKSKNVGKSGGFRIITFEVLATFDKKETILLTLFDKTESASISKAEIQKIMKDLFH